MIKDVIINVVGTQGIDGESDTVEFTTEGRFGKRDGNYFLSYDEGQLIEGAKVKTNLFINSQSSVVLQRKGEITSRMEITKGERSVCFYSTPIGDICIGIYGEKVEIDLDENGGSVYLGYTIDTDLKLISRNEVKITVRGV